MKCPGCGRRVWWGVIAYRKLWHRRCGAMVEAARYEQVDALFLIVCHQAGDHDRKPRPGCGFCAYEGRLAS